MYKYGLVGNCNVSALINENGSLDWLCLPQPDSEPVFGRLLDPNGGFFSIEFSDGQTAKCTQRYYENTNVLCTEMTNSDGDSYRIIDFCPRFEQHGRMFRPLTIIRIVEPIRGNSSIQVACRPISGWDKKPAVQSRGNSHINYAIQENFLRVTTNMSLTYLENQTPLFLKEKLYFYLSWNSSVDEDLQLVSHRFLTQTQQYWKTWVKHCSIPSLFQKETIRSALTLKLHCFEDTGAILAALTTSLPEEPGNTRNWDYRYCWLRDAYFVLTAFHNLGHFEEMEGFLKFILDIAHHHEASRERLAPVYTLGRELPLPEIIHKNWAGFQNSSPVRHNNQAAEHIQNDVYGEMILALSPVFFDERFYDLRTKEYEDLLIHFAKFATKSISLPDAGLWEVRNGWQEHTFTNLMLWAGIERLERIQKLGYLKNLSIDITKEKKRAEKAIEIAIKNGSARNGPKDESFDAALALMPILKYPADVISNATLDEIINCLKLKGDDHKGFFYRYTRQDDFGKPQAAFVVCSFWIIQALASLKRIDEAKSLLLETVSAANSLGLYAEHYLPHVKLQLGNFPQAYSHVGLINSAFAVSPPWSDIL